MIDDDLPRRLRIEADALGTSPTSSQMLRNAATLIDMLHDEIIQLRERVKELEFTNLRSAKIIFP